MSVINDGCVCRMSSDVQIPAGTLLAQRPGVVVVAVDERDGFVQGCRTIRQAWCGLRRQTGDGGDGDDQRSPGPARGHATFYGLLDRPRGGRLP